MRASKLVQCALAVAITVAGVTMTATGGQLKSVMEHDLSDGQIAPVLTALAIHPEGQYLAAAGDDHLIRIWDLRDQKITRTLDGHSDWVRSAIFTSDGKFLLTAGDDGRVIAWNTTDEYRRSYLMYLKKPIRDLAITPDERHIAVVGFKSDIRVTDLSSGPDNRRIEAKHDDLRDIEFSRDGKLVAVSSGDGSIHIHRWPDGKHLKVLKRHRQRVNNIRFMGPDNRLVSTSIDRTACVWSIETGEVERQFPLGRCKGSSLIVVNDDTIAVGGTDNSICVFDVHTGNPLDQFSGHTGTVAALAVHGQQLFSAGYDTTIRHWTIDLDSGNRYPPGQQIGRSGNETNR